MIKETLSPYLIEAGEDYFMFWCLGCKSHHAISLKKPNGWIVSDWKPLIISPSVRVTGGKNNITLCHLFIEKDHIRYLQDCPHELANQTVPMVTPKIEMIS